MEPAERTEQLGEIEVGQGPEDADDEQGILVREGEQSWRDEDADIEASFVEHELQVLEGQQLGVLRADIRGEIAAVGEEFQDGGVAVETLEIWVRGPFDWSPNSR